MEERYVIKALAAMAQTNRLQFFFRLLVVKGNQGLTPAGLAVQLGIVLTYLSQNCCQGDACEVSTPEMFKAC